MNEDIERPECVWCHKPLPVNAPSADFCGELHQTDWFRRDIQLEVPKWNL